MRTIKDNIIRLELPPGSHIGENELADKLGLTRMPDPLIEACGSFHAELLAIAEKSLSYDLMKAMSIHFDRVCSLPLNRVKSTHIIQDHDRIVKDIRQHDPVEALKLMDVHLRRVQPDISAIQTANPNLSLREVDLWP